MRALPAQGNGLHIKGIGGSAGMVVSRQTIPVRIQFFERCAVPRRPTSAFLSTQLVSLHRRWSAGTQGAKAAFVLKRLSASSREVVRCYTLELMQVYLILS